METQVLHNRQILVEPKALGHVADLIGKTIGIASGVQAEDLDRAGAGHHQPRHQPHQGGLARPIGADQPREPPGLDGRGQVLEGLNRAKDLGNPGQTHRRRGLAPRGV